MGERPIASRRVAWLSLVTLVGAATLSTASAQDRPGVALSWVRGSRAGACPDAPTLRAEVARRLGYDPFAAPAQIFLEGLVSHGDDGWAAHLYKRDATGALLGERELTSEADDCRALADATTLMVALAIDPDAAMRSTADAASAESPADPAEEEPVEEAPAADDAPALPNELEEAVVGQSAGPPRSRRSPRLGLGGAIAHDLIPGLGPGARLVVDGALTDLLRWQVDARHWPEQTISRGDARFGVGLTTASAGLCVGARFGRVGVEGCAGIDVGALVVVVYDPAPRDPGDRVFVGATAALRFTVELAHPVLLGLWGGAAIPFTRYDLRVVGQPTPVFTPDALAPIAGVEIIAVLGPE